jgi:hypothetical protein
MTDAIGEMLDDLSHATTRIQEMSEQYGDNPPAGSANDWGAARILRHMSEVEKLYRGRMQLILTRETPYLKAANLAADPGEALEFRPELEAFAIERGETISLLMNLALKDWERTGIHDEHGELSVEDIAERLIDHDNAHLAQLASAFQK